MVRGILYLIEAFWVGLHHMRARKFLEKWQKAVDERLAAEERAREKRVSG